MSRNYGARESHPLSGRTVKVKTADSFDGSEYVIENWWENVNPQPWEIAAMAGNFAALNYAMRVIELGLPNDSNVVYGKINSLGYIFHESEIAAPVEEESVA